MAACLKKSHKEEVQLSSLLSTLKTRLACNSLMASASIGARHLVV